MLTQAIVFALHVAVVVWQFVALVAAFVAGREQPMGAAGFFVTVKCGLHSCGRLQRVAIKHLCMLPYLFVFQFQNAHYSLENCFSRIATPALEYM